VIPWQVIIAQLTKFYSNDSGRPGKSLRVIVALIILVLWELTGKLVFIMDSRFHGNDTNTIIVIPAKAGIHPMQDSFPRYLPKSLNSSPGSMMSSQKHSQKDNFRFYGTGLLLEIKRKNIQYMSLHTIGSDYQQVILSLVALPLPLTDCKGWLN